MADSTPYPDTGAGPGRESPTGISRWQKVVGIIGLVLVLLFVLFVVLQVTGVGGGLPFVGDGGHTPGPPEGGH